MFQLRPWKFFLFPPTKTAAAFTFLLKALFLLIILVFLSFFSFTFFSGYSDDQAYVSLLKNHLQIKKIQVRPPVPAPTSISHIVFAIGGSYETWSSRCHYIETWWKPNITRGFVWLDRNPPPNETNYWLDIWPPYKVSENTSRFKYDCNYGSRSAIRIARIVKETFELGLDNVRWFVMGDDDTVFFTENLVTVLAKYDHNEMYYIGSVSESVEQDVIHSYTMGYGGGGFAISYPLAAELVKVLDGCIDRYSMFYGSDQRIGGCMTEIGVPLTKELGFHQVDIRGSPYGLLAAHPLTPLVSLHHLDYVQPVFPEKTRLESLKHLVQAYESDPSRVIQQSICYDFKRNWSISISWGYTIQLFPTLITPNELTTTIQTFLTWRTWSQLPFTFNTRIQSLDTCVRPLIYFLDKVKMVENGSSTLTSYEKVDDSKRLCDYENYRVAQSIQTFDVHASILDAETWKKAPRRQCCHVIGVDEREGVARLRLEECRQWESVTPPS